MIPRTVGVSFSKVSSYIKRVRAETISGGKVIMIIAIIIVETLVSIIGLIPKQNGRRHIPLSFYTLDELLLLPDSSEDLILTWRLH